MVWGAVSGAPLPSAAHGYLQQLPRRQGGRGGKGIATAPDGTSGAFLMPAGARIVAFRGCRSGTDHHKDTKAQRKVRLFAVLSG